MSHECEGVWGGFRGKQQYKSIDVCLLCVCVLVSAWVSVYERECVHVCVEVCDIEEYGV